MDPWNTHPSALLIHPLLDYLHPSTNGSLKYSSKYTPHLSTDGWFSSIYLWIRVIFIQVTSSSIHWWMIFIHPLMDRVIFIQVPSSPIHRWMLFIHPLIDLCNIHPKCPLHPSIDFFPPQAQKTKYVSESKCVRGKPPPMDPWYIHPSTLLIHPQIFPQQAKKITNVSEIVQIWQTKQKAGFQNVVIPKKNAPKMASKIW